MRLLPAKPGARLSGGRPEPVKGGSSVQAPQTLDRTRPQVPRTP